MTNSRSNRSPRSSWLHGFAALGLALLVLVSASAEASSRRKRIAVLEFEGPKAKTFYAAIVKLIKRRHTVVAADVWNRAAQDLDADKVTEKNIRRVAKRLKLDGVVTGTVEKRRDDYIVRLKLKAGANGELVGQRVDIKVRGAKLSAKAQREVKDELIAAMDDLDRSSGADESGDEEVADGDKSTDAAEAAEKPAGKPRLSNRPIAELDEVGTEKPRKASKVKNLEEDRDAPATTPAASEDAEVRTKADRDTSSVPGALTPSNRAIDMVLGMSLNIRRLQFNADADLANAPPSYRQRVPVIGGMIDATVYPLAFGHQRTGFLTGLGIEVAYDRVVRIRSEKAYLDAMNNKQVADLATTQDRFSIGGVLRYPITPRVVIGGKAIYSRQQFDIAQQLPNAAPTDVPSVLYAMLEPKLFVMFVPAPAIALHVEGGAMVVSDTGGIANAMTGYGSTSGSGFEASVGLDFHVTRAVFFRILGRLERLSLTFKGDANSLATSRDDDPMQDVHGATDLYYGGAATIGFAY